MSRGSKAQLLRKPRQPIEGLFCSYTHRTCMQNRLEGYEFCLKHILEDKNAPFKQCSYTSSKNGKRCSNAAPKSDKKDGYCIEHSKKALLLRQRASRKRRPRETAESLLEELDQYSEMRQLQEGIPTNLLSERLLATPGGEPTNQKRLKPRNDNPASRALEYATSSDSDEEPLLVDQAWRGDGDSDAESIDSEQEDPLKHAGVYTAEEVALIMRDKLIRLQSLYIDQFKRLQHILREKRRKYLKTYKQEMETLGGIGAYKKDHEQRESYCKLEAMRRYHKRYGKEALLHRQSKQRRIAASEGPNHKPTPYSKCIHTEDKAKCSARAVPLSKYCKDHILNDPHQVLYRSCSFGAGACRRPVASIEVTAVCPLHVLPSDREPRVPVKKAAETDRQTHVDVTEDPSYRSVAGKEIGLNGDASEDYKEQKTIKGQLLLQHLQGHGPDLSRSQGLSTNQTTAMASQITNQTTATASKLTNIVQPDMGLTNQITLSTSDSQNSMLTSTGTFQHQQGMSTTSTSQHQQGMSTTGTGPHQQGMSTTGTGPHQQGMSTTGTGPHQQITNTTGASQHQQGMSTTSTGLHQPAMSTVSTAQHQQGMSTTSTGLHQQGMSTVSTDQHQLGMSTISTGQHQQGMSTTSAGQHQQGMSTASKGQHQLEISTTSTGQHQQGMSTTSTGLHQQGMSTASKGQHQQETSTTSIDQHQQEMSTASTGQHQQGTSTASTGQHQQGTSTSVVEGDGLHDSMDTS